MSLIPEERKTPDFEVCSQNYQVENSEKWSVGHTTEWQYKSKSEETWDEDDKRMDVIAQNGNEGLHYN